MDDNVQVIPVNLPIAECVGSSMYAGGIHFIFINTNATLEEQEEAEKRERARKVPK